MGQDMPFSLVWFIPVLSELTKQNGAQDWLVKQHTSAEDLDHAIQKAIASVKSL